MFRRAVPLVIAPLAVAGAVVVGVMDQAPAQASPAHAATAAAPRLILTPRVVGRLRIGMTLPAARRASVRRIRLSGRELTPGCRYASVPSLRVALMLLDGRIARIEIGRSSPVRVRGGLRRGDTERDVRAVFGPKVVETQHTYVLGGSYLT